jgi:hypothetical protein
MESIHEHDVIVDFRSLGIEDPTAVWRYGEALVEVILDSENGAYLFGREIIKTYRLERIGGNKVDSLRGNRE